jgi:hypothetical protein
MPPRGNGGGHDRVQRRSISHRARQRTEVYRTAQATEASFKGLRGGALTKTGDRTFCFVAEWTGMQKIVNARPQMTGLLDQMRDLLEDLGGGLGVTDPVRAKWSSA